MMSARRSMGLLGLGMALAGAAPLASQTGGNSAPSDPDQRARAVEAQMTDDERLRLLVGIIPFQIPGQKPVEPVSNPSSGRVPGVPRLGIPELVETDASLGITNPFDIRKGDGATALPSGLAMASTFDPGLVSRVGMVLGSEARARGFNVLLGGGINLTRDWYGGRNFEYLGEDPLLAGVLGGASVDGIQSKGVIATVKHYALNSQETLRDTLDARIDEAGLRESDLLAFQIAIERGKPGSVMCGYNRVNGVYACESSMLLNNVLKRDWGYKGWVMSDWGAVHGVHAFAAGLDQESGSQLDKQVWFGAPLSAELSAGRISRGRLSDAVRRMLRSIFEVGADRMTTPEPANMVANARVAREVAAQGMVLLKNDGALPIAPTHKRILVVGGHADIGVMSGWGSSQVQPVGGYAASIPIGGGSGFSQLSRQNFHPSSPVRALQKRFPQARIAYESGYSPQAAAAYAAKADMVIVFATQWQTESLDNPDLALPAGQDALISAVARANPNTVVVLETGNPVLMPWLGSVRAVLEAWYPGSQGGEAIADVLSGDVNPAGRLPISFPLDPGQTPRATPPGLGEQTGADVAASYIEGSDVGYRWLAGQGAHPLFAFGHGLSYTTFAHSALRIARAGSAIRADVAITNTGNREGSDVVQVYLVTDAKGRPMRRLAGFGRITLAPHGSRALAIEIEPRIVAEWAGKGWQIDSGEYSFQLGRSALDLIGNPTSIKMPKMRLAP